MKIRVEAVTRQLISQWTIIHLDLIFLLQAADIDTTSWVCLFEWASPGLLVEYRMGLRNFCKESHLFTTVKTVARFALHFILSPLIPSIHLKPDSLCFFLKLATLLLLPIVLPTNNLELSAVSRNFRRLH